MNIGFCFQFYFVLFKSFFNAKSMQEPIRQGLSTFLLSSRPYLDPYNYDQSYRNIVTINGIPRGPLRAFVRRVQFLPLSEFKEPYGNKCGLVLLSLRGGSFMCVDEVPELFSFLLSHGYKIDTSLTKMTILTDVRFHTNNANKMIGFVTYRG
jgi:hypothetical protein